MDEKLKGFHDATGIPINVYNGDDLTQSFSNTIFLPNPASVVLKQVQHTMAGYTISPERMLCGIIMLPASSQRVIIGPVMEFECTQKQVQRILADMGEPLTRTDELLRRLQATPLCTLSRFKSILDFLCGLLHVKSEQVEQIPYTLASQKAQQVVPDHDFISHFNSKIETEILSCIEYGNPEMLLEMMSRMDQSGEYLPMRSTDALRVFKNIFIGSNALASRVAVAGGLDYDTALTVSDRYLAQIEALESYPQILFMLQQMFIDYAQRVLRSRSPKQDSPIVSKIHKYIRAHLYEKIALEEIAQHLKLNQSHICRHFKQETGVTIVEHINASKIKETKRLLASTNLTIVEISTRLGFSSQNYFHTLFHKVTGLTPTEFRRNIVND